MSDHPGAAATPVSEPQSFDVRMRVGSVQLRIQVQMPAEPLSLPEFLPIVQSLTDAVAAAATRGLERAGRRISCGPGCGTCCRQLVPIGEIEALYLHDLLSGMDPDHRARIEQRFATAVRKLSRAGLLEELDAADSLATREARRDLGQRYFRLGIPCPFLENESCGIHAQRPLACREYLVTSPAARCAEPTGERVELLELPRRPSTLLYRFSDGVGLSRPRWLPLISMLHWTPSGDVLAARRTFAGSALFERFLHGLADAKAEDMDSPETSQP